MKTSNVVLFSGDRLFSSIRVYSEADLSSSEAFTTASKSFPLLPGGFCSCQLPSAGLGFEADCHLTDWLCKLRTGVTKQNLRWYEDIYTNCKMLKWESNPQVYHVTWFPGGTSTASNTRATQKGLHRGKKRALPALLGAPCMWEPPPKIWM